MFFIDLDRWLYELMDEVCLFVYGVEFIEVVILMDLVFVFYFLGNIFFDYIIYIIN